MPNSYSQLTRSVVDYIANVQLQHKNKWELAIAPKALGGGIVGSSVASVALDVLLAAGGTIAMKFYAQKITIPFPDFETDEVDGIKYLKEVKHPTECEIEFLEDEKGTALRLFTAWQRKIGSPPAGFSGFGGVYTALYGRSTDNSYVFDTGLQNLKRTFIFKLIGANDGATALFYPSIFISGCFPKKIGDYEHDQETGDFISFKATFSIDTVFPSRVL